MNEPTILNSESWLQLGVAGAALFILFIFVYMYMRNNSKSIGDLCRKIDRLVDSNAESNKILSVTLTQWNVEQKNNTSFLEQIANNTNTIGSKIDVMHGKIDALLNLKCKAVNRDDE
jgi:hypothetical protein